jgi:hypothetical protein
MLNTKYATFLTRPSFLLLDDIKRKYSILPSEAIIESQKPWQHLEFLSLFYAYHKIVPPNAHILNTRPSILVWWEPCIQERGNIYIHQYTKTNYQFSYHKSSKQEKEVFEVIMQM